MAIKRSLPLSSMERVLKKCGAERVSDDAKEALKQIVEERAGEIAQRAVKVALHTGRKTVKAADIKLAAKR
jgi:DNA-binding protein